MNDTTSTTLQEFSEPLNQLVEVSENVNDYNDILTYIAEQQTLTNNILLFIVGTVSALLVCYILYRFIRKFI